jgi:predicted secreted protein
MAVNSGIDGKVMVSAATIATIDEWSSDIKEKINTYTAFGSAWESKLKGVKSLNGSCKGTWDYADTTGQKVLADIIVGSTTSVALKLYYSTTGYFSFTAFLSGMKVSNKVDGKCDVEFNFESSGTVTIA